MARYNTHKKKQIKKQTNTKKRNNKRQTSTKRRSNKRQTNKKGRSNITHSNYTYYNIGGAEEEDINKLDDLLYNHDIDGMIRYYRLLLKSGTNVEESKEKLVNYTQQMITDFSQRSNNDNEYVDNEDVSQNPEFKLLDEMFISILKLCIELDRIDLLNDIRLYEGEYDEMFENEARKRILTRIFYDENKFKELLDYIHRKDISEETKKTLLDILFDVYISIHIINNEDIDDDMDDDMDDVLDDDMEEDMEKQKFYPHILKLFQYSVDADIFDSFNQLPKKITNNESKEYMDEIINTILILNEENIEKIIKHLDKLDLTDETKEDLKDYYKEFQQKKLKEAELDTLLPDGVIDTISGY